MDRDDRLLDLARAAQDAPIRRRLAHKTDTPRREEDRGWVLFLALWLMAVGFCTLLGFANVSNRLTGKDMTYAFGAGTWFYFGAFLTILFVVAAFFAVAPRTMIIASAVLLVLLFLALWLPSRA